MMNHYTVNSAREAWEKADEIFPTDYMQDLESSRRAGYPIYRSTAEGHYYDYICDLNCRLEVNLCSGKTINIWVDDRSPLEKAGFKKNQLGIWVAA